MFNIIWKDVPKITKDDILELHKTKELFKYMVAYKTKVGSLRVLRMSTKGGYFGFVGIMFDNKVSHRAITLTGCLAKAMSSNELYLLDYSEVLKFISNINLK